jgi:hypothetical protein
MVWAGGTWAGRAALWGAEGWGLWRDPAFLADGLRYTVPFLFFLTVHEFGHYLMARRHRVDVSLPYFIPIPPGVPILNIGTFGAVIRIRQVIPRTRELFDIGVAGPLAGFAVALGALALALSHPPPADVRVRLRGGARGHPGVRTPVRDLPHGAAARRVRVRAAGGGDDAAVRPRERARAGLPAGVGAVPLPRAVRCLARPVLYGAEPPPGGAARRRARHVRAVRAGVARADRPGDSPGAAVPGALGAMGDIGECPADGAGVRLPGVGGRGGDVGRAGPGPAGADAEGVPDALRAEDGLAGGAGGGGRGGRRARRRRRRWAGSGGCSGAPSSCT